MDVLLQRPALRPATAWRHRYSPDFHSIALFYEQDRNALLAGKFYCLSQNYRKGVKLLLSAITQSPAVESEAFQLVIEAAAKSQEDAVVRQVVDFLVGDVDGSPRDFKYLFRLYMKLGHYKEAAKTAIAIAREEQSSGNYRNAHSLLLGMSRELRKHDIRIPAEMNSSLVLIHSYLLAKVLIHVLWHSLFPVHSRSLSADRRTAHSAVTC